MSCDAGRHSYCNDCMATGCRNIIGQSKTEQRTETPRQGGTRRDMREGIGGNSEADLET